MNLALTTSLTIHQEKLGKTRIIMRTATSKTVKNDSENIDDDREKDKHDKF